MGLFAHFVRKRTCLVPFLGKKSVGRCEYYLSELGMMPRMVCSLDKHTVEKTV